MFVWLVPSAFMTKTSEFDNPFRYLKKTIFVPSGDQAGARSCSLLLVSWVLPVPSALML